MRAPTLLVLCAAAFAAPSLRAQSLDQRLLSGLVWRNVGPFRAGRVSAVSGAIGQPGVFYFGAADGGVWKTTSAGATWFPIFDSITSVYAIGAVAVAPSDPNVIYVGAGDRHSLASGIGDGMYKSSDAGHTWRHIGLDTTQQIAAILVDPRDPNVVLVAALGGFFQSPNGGRGAFRSTDGGATWARTLYIDDQTGISELTRAADAPDVVFATTLYRSFPTGTGGPPAQDTARTRSRLYKSSDAGVSWREISGAGLPRLEGRVSIAAGTNAQRVYLIGNFGLYRSDDGGTSWRQMAADDKRITNGQGGYTCGVYVDPKNPDIVYTFHVTAYRSTDGGNTFTAFKGGPPGGDDPQVMWIDPTNGKRILMGYDQGAIVSFDGGDNWSSWYNQSTEQVYHVAADNSFPYWIYATQQDAGAIATSSRGNLGAVTSLDWKPVPGWEWGTILPNPRDANEIYSSGLSIAKIRYPSGEWINIGPDQDPSLKLRASLNLPIAFTTWRGRQELLAGYQHLMATADGGVTWSKLSPDLTVKAHPASSDTSMRGSLWSIAPSNVQPDVIWVGTSNAIVQVTRDHGKTWSDVTTSDIAAGLRYTPASLEASPFDARTAFAVFDLEFRGDRAPYIYRTHDSGKTWTKIVTGLPAGAPGGASVHVVRADPQQRGLLFAGTESGVFVSFDDGDHWQSLQLNLPTTIINDIAIHDNDLIVGTYGRGIWVLDDYALLRQLGGAGAMATRLFKPSNAVRVRRNVDFNTPFPKEEPQAPNPPAGAIIYYGLGTKPAADVALDVLDAKGSVVRHLTSAPATPVREAPRAPMEQFWLAPQTSLSVNVGLNRAVWDLRYDPPPAFAHTFAFNGNPGSTPPLPEGPLALPGVYTVRLTVDGRSFTQRLTVRPDPRTHVMPATYATQHALLMRLYSAVQSTWADFTPVSTLRAAVKKIAPNDTTSDVGKAAKAFATTLDSIAGDSLVDGRQVWDGPPDSWSFADLNGEFGLQLSGQDNADQRPTQAALALARSTCDALRKLVDRWDQVVAKDLPAFDRTLQGRGVTALTPPTARVKSCS
jgi:photosystem II stability/assembly factor-like uncharacterized protein